MDRKASAGISTTPKKPTSNRKYDENEFGGELLDIWAAPAEIKSKKFETWKNGFSKKTAPNVKAVINPTGGHSYNPSVKDHKKLLKEVASTEEQIVEKNLKELRKLRPLLYSENKHANSDEEADKVSSEEIDSSEEEIDIEKPLAVGKVVDRNNLKTQSQRNKDLASKLKAKLMQEEHEKKKFQKDIDRLENLIKQNDNVSKKYKNKLDKKYKATAAELKKQAEVGIVTKPKNIGRFKYNQRKADFQLEEDLAGNLRQLRPLGGDQLLLDRFDSVFRRNLVEPDAPTQQDKKRQRKQKYKMHNKLGTKSQEIFEATQSLKKKNDEKEKGLKNLVNSDVIMI